MEKVMQTRIFDIDASDWQTVREDLTQGVFGRSLLPPAAGETKVVLTRVTAGGAFPLHSDPYHHVLLFMGGIGEGWLDGESYEIRPGRVAEIPAGIAHGYRNTGDEDLVLLTINIPAVP
jgi:quercetin dioxygenase-like cupin family protein